MEDEIPRIQGKCAFIENIIIVDDKLLLVHVTLCADKKEGFANLSFWSELHSIHFNYSMH